MLDPLPTMDISAFFITAIELHPRAPPLLARPIPKQRVEVGEPMPWCSISRPEENDDLRRELDDFDEDETDEGNDDNEIIDDERDDDEIDDDDGNEDEGGGAWDFLKVSLGNMALRRLNFEFFLLGPFLEL